MKKPFLQAGQPTTWARQIEARYRCRLSEDLANWFDDEIWRWADGSTGNAFDSAVEPTELLSESPDAIWPALMPCDLLPILGNQMGDWLCIRIDRDNSAAQVVHWYHGGGDWIPWGDCVAQAVLFDHVRSRLPGADRDHAESTHGVQKTGNSTRHRLVEWAASFVDGWQSREQDSVAGRELANALLSLGVSEPAIRCQLVIDALDNPLLSNELIETLKSNHPQEVQHWLFDNRLIPDRVLDSITASSGQPVDVLLSQQDWPAVREHCRFVTRHSAELAWAWDLIGYSFERDGNRDEAVTNYRRGLDCSIFTDQAVRVRTHGFHRDGQKFSAIRLEQLEFRSDDQDEREYLNRLHVPKVELRRKAIQEYFVSQAEKCSQSDLLERAHDLWQRAAWDLGAEPMSAFADLLENIARAAEDAGRAAQASVAQTHRECFRQRYRA